MPEKEHGWAKKDQQKSQQNACKNNHPVRLSWYNLKKFIHAKFEKKFTINFSKFSCYQNFDFINQRGIFWVQGLYKC